MVLAAIVGDRSARLLWRRFGSLNAVGRATADEFESSGAGLTAKKVKCLRAAFSLADRLANEILPDPCPLHSTAQVVDVLREEFRLLSRERLTALFLNTGGHLIANVTLAEGSVNQVSVQPYEVFYPALRLQATGVILAHNHTSGNPTPSQSDIDMTRSIHQVGKHLNIPLIDHVILGYRTVGRDCYFASLRDLGYMQE